MTRSAQIYFHCSKGFIIARTTIRSRKVSSRTKAPRNLSRILIEKSTTPTGHRLQSPAPDLPGSLLPFGVRKLNRTSGLRKANYKLPANSRRLKLERHADQGREVYNYWRRIRKQVSARPGTISAIEVDRLIDPRLFVRTVFRLSFRRIAGT